MNELSLAREAALEAGEFLKGAYGTDHRVLLENGRDVKLQADRDSEAIILKSLQEKSHWPILSEETGEHGPIDPEGTFWIVDPLDGTFNFSHGIPWVCVSVGFWKEGHPCLGVVFDFLRDELIEAGPAGVELNGSPVVVSSVDHPSRAVLGTGFPVNRDFGSTALEQFLTRVKEFKKLRLLGSAALSLTYVAAGRLDAYSEEGIMLWDVAAGMAMVEAAGGHVRFRRSGHKKWSYDVAAAATPELLESLTRDLV